MRTSRLVVDFFLRKYEYCYSLASWPKESKKRMHQSRAKMKDRMKRWLRTNAAVVMKKTMKKAHRATCLRQITIKNNVRKYATASICCQKKVDKDMYHRLWSWFLLITEPINSTEYFIIIPLGANLWCASSGMALSNVRTCSSDRICTYIPYFFSFSSRTWFGRRLRLYWKQRAKRFQKYIFAK